LLDDFLGDGFALLSLPQTPPSLFNRLAADLWQPLHLRRIAIQAPRDSAISQTGVVGVVDLDGDFSRSMKHLPTGLFLIRPDRYVAAFLPAENFEAATREVDNRLATTWN